MKVLHYLELVKNKENRDLLKSLDNKNGARNSLKFQKDKRQEAAIKFCIIKKYIWHIKLLIKINIGFKGFRRYGFLGQFLKYLCRKTYVVRRYVFLRFCFKSKGRVAKKIEKSSVLYLLLVILGFLFNFIFFFFYIVNPLFEYIHKSFEWCFDDKI